LEQRCCDDSAIFKHLFELSDASYRFKLQTEGGKLNGWRTVLKNREVAKNPREQQVEKIKEIN